MSRLLSLLSPKVDTVVKRLEAEELHRDKSADERSMLINATDESSLIEKLEEDLGEDTRLELFTDAALGIICTIFVLPIMEQLKEGEQPTVHSLLHWVGMYVTAFTAVLYLEHLHIQTMQRLVEQSLAVVWLNALWLFAVGLLPASNLMMSTTPRWNDGQAEIVFLILIGVALVVLEVLRWVLYRQSKHADGVLAKKKSKSHGDRSLTTVLILVLALAWLAVMCLCCHFISYYFVVGVVALPLIRWTLSTLDHRRHPSHNDRFHMHTWYAAGRLEGLSDGIIVFAATLIALDLPIPVPSDGSGSLFHVIFSDYWRQYLSYAFVFCLLGSTWYVHAVIMHDFVGEVASWGLFWANGLFLASVGLVPAAAKAFFMFHGEANEEGASSKHIAVFFAIVTLAMALAELLIWRLVLPDHLRKHAVSTRLKAEGKTVSAFARIRHSNHCLEAINVAVHVLPVCGLLVLVCALAGHNTVAFGFLLSYPLIQVSVAAFKGFHLHTADEKRQCKVADVSATLSGLPQGSVSTRL